MKAQQPRALSWACAEDSERVFGRGMRLTDKRPDNFLYFGLIKAMFPRAKVVVTLRDWREVASSVFATRLGPVTPFSTDVRHVRHVIVRHDRLVARWRSLFGDVVAAVRYEDIVANPRGTIERRLAGLGESWDEHSLAFHEVCNTVQTASVWQVRRPLYAGSVGSWCSFHEQITAVFGPGVGDSA